MEAMAVAKAFTTLCAPRCASLHPGAVKVPRPSKCATLGCSKSLVIGAEMRARAKKRGGIGSGRKQRGMNRKDTMQAETDTTLPFLEPHIRTHKEEGHQVLVDVEYLLLRAPNPFGLVLEIAEEANECLRQNKEDSLRRKPVLKVISDRINEAVGEEVCDAYVDDQPDYEEYES